MLVSLDSILYGPLVAGALSYSIPVSLAAGTGPVPQIKANGKSGTGALRLNVMLVSPSQTTALSKRSWPLTGSALGPEYSETPSAFFGMSRKSTRYLGPPPVTSEYCREMP